MQGCTLTKQEMFDTALNGLRGQGHPSYEPGVGGSKTCLYRAGNGDRCAVGWLLPDELYSKTMEGSTVDNNPALAEYFGEENMSFLRTLQRAHDEWAVHNFSMDEWEKDMAKVARYYRLAYTPQGAPQRISSLTQEIRLTRSPSVWNKEAWLDGLDSITPFTQAVKKDFAYHEIAFA